MNVLVPFAGGSAGVAIWWLGVGGGGVGRDVGIPFAGEFLLWLDWRRYSGSVWGPGAGKRPSGVNLAEAFSLADTMSPSRVLPVCLVLVL